MKIYNEVVIDMNTGETIYEDSFDYDGDMALCCDPGAGQQLEGEELAEHKAKMAELDAAKRDWGLEALSMDQFYTEEGGVKTPKTDSEILNLILQHKPYDIDADKGKTEQQYKDNLLTQIRKMMPKLTSPDAKKQAFLAEEKEMTQAGAELTKQKAEDVYGLGVSAAGREAQKQAGQLGTQMRGAYGGMGGGMRGAVGGQRELTGTYGDELKQLGQQRGYAGTQYDLTMQKADLTERKGQYGLEKAAEADWEGSMSTWLSGFKEGGRVPDKRTFLDVLSKIPDAGGS